MVYVARNFKSIVFTAASQSTYKAESITSNSASDFDTTIEEDGRQYNYYPDCKNYKKENNQNEFEANFTIFLNEFYVSRDRGSCKFENFDKHESTSSYSSNDRIGDIVGISTR